MASGYVIGQITIHDPDNYPTYVAMVKPSLDAYKGRFLVRGGASQTFEGDAPGERTVVIEFPSYQAALDWYNSPEYADAKKLRMSLSSSVQTIVEGV